MRVLNRLDSTFFKEGWWKMLECDCGTVAVPMGERIPRGWTLRGGGEKHLCPLCSMVEREKKRKEKLS